jgi:tetratricopeptide (TPR) repeat protein
MGLMNRVAVSSRRRTPGLRRASLALVAVTTIVPISTQALEQEVKLEPQLNQRVDQLLHLHRYAEAMETAKIALERFSAAFGMRHAETATCLRNLAVCHTRLRKFPEAEPLYLQAVSIQEQIYGPKDPHTLETMGELAEHYERAGEFRKAEELLKRVLAVQDRWGTGHVARLRSLERLGVVYTDMERFEEAEALLKTALDLLEKSNGEKFVRNAKCIEELARVKQGMGNFSEAETFYLRALAMVEKGFGPKKVETAAFVNNLGTLYSAMGQYEKAQAHFRRALEVLRKAYGPEDPDAKICLHNLANAEAAAAQQPRPKGQSAITI